MKNQISIIIPVYNEEKFIGDLLAFLIRTNQPFLEIIVVDSKSTDNTAHLVKKFTANSQIHYFKSPHKGRAEQMNYGAQQAKGNLLYFLHADSTPPIHFIDLINANYNLKALAGCFQLTFDANQLFYKFWQWFTRFNLLVARGGDQSLYISKQLFNTIGKYDVQWTKMEDIDIIERIQSQTRFTIINAKIKTSIRKYERNGKWKLQLVFSIMHLLKILHFKPNYILSFYLKRVT